MIDRYHGSQIRANSENVRCMINLSNTQDQIRCIENFQDLVSTPFSGKMNAVCWTRDLVGDFSEIVSRLESGQPLAEVNLDALRGLQLTEQGQLARDLLLMDFQLLKAHGASPTLNLIKHYERDDFFFPTDVYSFHVDRSPIPTDTFLCTYHGAASELVANSQAEQKVLIPEIRVELKKIYDGPTDGFESFLSEYFFDLHYRAKHDDQIINLGQGHLWRLAVDHPESNCEPCVHRAPEEKDGETRLLLIC